MANGRDGRHRPEQILVAARVVVAIVIGVMFTIRQRQTRRLRQTPAEGDDLIRKLMAKRGYPVGDFEMRAADISVDLARPSRWVL